MQPATPPRSRGSGSGQHSGGSPSLAPGTPLKSATAPSLRPASPEKSPRTLAITAPVSGTSTTGSEVFQGWLRKKGAVRRNWKKRWFLLESGVMKYYKVELKNGKDLRELKGTFTVHDAQCSYSTGPTGKKYLNAFMVHSLKRTYYMVAEDAAAVDYWKRGLIANNAIWGSMSQPSPFLHHPYHHTHPHHHHHHHHLHPHSVPSAGAAASSSSSSPTIRPFPIIPIPLNPPPSPPGSASNRSAALNIANTQSSASSSSSSSPAVDTSNVVVTAPTPTTTATTTNPPPISPTGSASSNSASTPLAITSLSDKLVFPLDLLRSPRPEPRLIEGTAGNATTMLPSVGAAVILEEDQETETIILPDHIKWPVFAVHVKFTSAGGNAYLNSKQISELAEPRVNSTNKQVSYVNEFLLFEDPSNTLTMLLRIPSEPPSDGVSKLIGVLAVRDLDDANDQWISLGHKIQASYSYATRQFSVECSPDHERAKRLLKTFHLGPPHDPKSHIGASIRFNIICTPFPLWSWAKATPLREDDLQTIKSALFTATAEIHQLMVERKDDQLRSIFFRLLRDFAYQSLKIADYGSETEAINHLFRSCLLGWLESPRYRLAPFHRTNESAYRVAVCDRFATLVTDTSDWPIVFLGKGEAEGQDEPANFVFSCVEGKWVPSLFWNGTFP